MSRTSSLTQVHVPERLNTRSSRALSLFAVRSISCRQQCHDRSCFTLQWFRHCATAISAHRQRFRNGHLLQSMQVCTGQVKFRCICCNQHLWIQCHVCLSQRQQAFRQLKGVITFGWKELNSLQLFQLTLTTPHFRNSRSCRTARNKPSVSAECTGL